VARYVVFTLTSGRSGTLFLSTLLRRNARGCAVMHEPYLRPGNPNMFGQPIYDHFAGNRDAIRILVRQKRDTIEKYSSVQYIETSHAFLKSYWDIAPEFFPEMKIIHLIRHPLQVARSEANRETLINRWRLPLRYYRAGDGRKYFRWSLTGRESIFGSFDPGQLSLFQRYLIQWIEIENRAMTFLDRFDLRSSCMTLHSPQDLNDAHAINKLLRFLNIEIGSRKVIFPANQNRNPLTPTVIGAKEIYQCRKIIKYIPAQYLEIFEREPYANCDWNTLLQK
jgi:hypothetical protein